MSGAWNAGDRRTHRQRQEVGPRRRGNDGAERAVVQRHDLGTDVVKRVVKVGDIIIIPAGVPHGWTNITDHVDYLSFRPSAARARRPATCIRRSSKNSVMADG